MAAPSYFNFILCNEGLFVSEKNKTGKNTPKDLIYINPDFFDGRVDRSLIKFRIKNDIILPLMVEKDLETIKEKIKSNFYSSPYILEKVAEAIINLEDFNINQN